MVQLALVPIAVGVMLLVVVPPAVVMNLTPPRESPTDGATAPPIPERIDPDTDVHRPQLPAPTRKPESVLLSQEHPLAERIGAARELGRSSSPKPCGPARGRELPRRRHPPRRSHGPRAPAP
ncbi:MAG: hypothetical protein R3F62_17925 [Planctomycetota bacterium]